MTVNGKSLGIYSHIEAVDKHFLPRHFSSAKGNLYEVSISDFRPGWVNAFESKNHKQENDRSDLQKVVAALESQEGVAERVSKILDVDAYLSFWATETLIGHWDGYAGNQNNAFVYHDPKPDKFRFIAWGADATFGGDNLFIPYEPPASVMANSFLSRRLYNDPATREKYRQRMRELLANVWKENDLLAEVDRLEKMVRGKVTIPAVLFDGGLNKVRNYIRTHRAEIESELAQPATAWTYPMRTERYYARVGKFSASFSTFWSTNLLGVELTNFPPRQVSQLELDFYGRKYSSPVAKSRTGISLRHPTWATLQLMAPVEDLRLPVGLYISINTNSFLKGGTIPMDGKQAIGYLLAGDRSMNSYRVLSFLSDGKGSITLNQSGLKPGDEVSGRIEAEVSGLRWEDFDLKVFNQIKADRK